MQNLLNDFSVIIQIAIPWSDMDAFQHVNNVNYFRYFQQARFAYFEKIRFFEIAKELGIGPILAETSCKFRAPLTHPDTISVGTRVDTLQNDRFTMHYRIVSPKLQKVAADGQGLIVAFNYHKDQKSPLPPEVRQRILELEPQL